MRISRQFWVVAHRWAGLYLTLWLSIVGLTGAVLAFYPELERAAAGPPAFTAPVGQAPLLAEVLIERAVQLAPAGSQLNFTLLKVERDTPFTVSFTSATGEETQTEVALNPFTGQRIVDERAETTMQTVLNTIYDLHYSLLLGEWGSLFLGISALIWTVDCFVGGYLTFPVKRKAASPYSPGWLARWRPSWRIRRRTNGYKFSFDLHRAGGLWVWAMLLMFAWSSVAFNLGQVYTPVMQIFGYVDYYAEQPARAKLRQPAIGWQSALNVARKDALQTSQREGFAIMQDGLLNYDSDSGQYRYVFISSQDTQDVNQSEIFVDARQGQVTSRQTAANRLAANTFTDWILSLHMARWGGLAFKIFVCFMGLLITALCVTGVIIWMRKRAARIAGRNKPLRLREEISANLAPSE